MHPAVARPFEALEAHRTDLEARLSSLGPGVAGAAPVPGAWSLAQIVDHFVRIEQSVRPEGRDGSAWEQATSPLRAGTVRAVLALPLQIAVPPGADAIVPATSPDLAESLVTWAHLRATWRDALVAAGPDDLQRFVLRHPLAGRFRWSDTLAFLLAHHRHHDRQIERTLAAVSA